MGGNHLMELETPKMLEYFMQSLQTYREAGACWHL